MSNIPFVSTYLVFVPENFTTHLCDLIILAFFFSHQQFNHIAIFSRVYVLLHTLKANH